jgi:hypothetical protein
MRIPNARLVRIGSLTSGAIVEQGDGEIIISPVFNPNIDLASPINKVSQADVGSPGFEDSFQTFTRSQSVGAQIAATTTVATLRRGMWVMQYCGVFSFNGTTNQNKFAGFVIQDPDGVTNPLLEFMLITNQVVPFYFEQRYTFQRDAFLFATSLPATVAGDELNLAVSIGGRRVL